ncbi:acyltransferase [Bacteroides ovatus]|uniref:acyltransferase n=1 Tax=Bacteroides ovatus TaxID=28116 RepID=UPI00232E5782|nr:acyltransferase [Bacteroides ovatus]MDC2771566.1 acyltransferase [Bacteroides ovatus]MDC2781687.1 acyltransferase [Bacteroides ovatus]MDC2786333.1 acyltransferase [Bacteroides ovatus]MDC2791484.1 acyltransferase [Bacteroides ovatus]MDC2795933.1 acyltransferase [Bacteroides ovatus]
MLVIFLIHTYLYWGTSDRIRVICAKLIFKKSGNIDVINRRVYFGNGTNIVIGHHSTLGAQVNIPNDTIIGNYVMISRQTHILHGNHEFSRIDIPIKLQGDQGDRQTIIEDDVWIGMRSFLTPGRKLKKGTIVAACSVLTKDFDEYTVVGGNPAHFIKSRKL